MRTDQQLLTRLTDQLVEKKNVVNFRVFVGDVTRAASTCERDVAHDPNVRLSKTVSNN